MFGFFRPFSIYNVDPDFNWSRKTWWIIIGVFKMPDSNASHVWTPTFLRLYWHLLNHGDWVEQCPKFKKYVMDTLHNHTHPFQRAFQIETPVLCIRGVDNRKSKSLICCSSTLMDLPPQYVKYSPFLIHDFNSQSSKTSWLSVYRVHWAVWQVAHEDQFYFSD